MKNVRAILTGALIWLFVFTTFSVLDYVPSISDSLNQQTLIVALLIIPYAILGASVFYKNGNKVHGLISATIMSVTAIMLDVLITVPFVEMPKGGSYISFFTYPLFWLLVTINMATVYSYWFFKIKQG